MKKVLSLILSVLLVLSLVPMAVGADAVPAWDELAYYQDGPEFSVSATGFTGDASNYKFYAAAYDENGYLLHVACADVAVEGGELKASVNLEKNVEEASVHIDYVKTMLWDGVTPVVRNGHFDIDEQTVSPEGIYNNLTNGFYESIYGDDVTYALGRNWSYKFENGSYAFKQNSANDDNKVMCDNNLTTEYGATSGTTHAVQQLIVSFSAGCSVDRVVVYNASNGQLQEGLEFYLSAVSETVSNGATYVPNFVENANTANAYYLGTQMKHPTVTAGVEKAKLVFDVTEPVATSFKSIVAQAKTGVSPGPIQEMQAYKKVQASDVVTSFAPRANFEAASYTQDGPVFSVNATGFTSNINGFTLVATAFDASGTQVGETLESPAAVNEGVLSGSVDFEPGDNVEADSSIASVTVSVIAKEYANMTIVPEKTFTLTVPTVEGTKYSSLTNGFYESVKDSEGVAITHTGKNRYFNYDTTQSKWVVSAGQNQVNLCDGDINTYAGGASAANTVAENQLRQFQAELSQKAKIDRVVIYIRWYDNNNTMQFYLSNSLTGASTCGDYIGATNNEKGVLYLGVPAGKGTAGQAYKNVFDVTGGLEGGYQYITTHPVVGNYYGPVYEMQAYQKVSATQTVK